MQPWAGYGPPATPGQVALMRALAREAGSSPAPADIQEEDGTMTKRVIAAYQDKDGTYIQVLDDGTHMEWSQPDQGWVRMLPPLPPGALGEVAGESEEIMVGDEVILDGRVPVIVSRVDKEFGVALVTWGAVSATCNLSRLTKVQP